MDNEKFQELVLQQFNKIDRQLQSLTDGQEELNKKVGSMDTRLKTVEEGQTRIESRMDKLESKVDKLELRMENEVIEKIRGLYEDREVQHDVNSRVLAALERIESKIERHDIQISILDKTKATKRKTR